MAGEVPGAGHSRFGWRRAIFAVIIGGALAVGWGLLAKSLFAGTARSLWPAWVIVLSLAAATAWLLAGRNQSAALRTVGFEVVGASIVVVSFLVVLSFAHECGPSTSFWWEDGALAQELAEAPLPDDVERKFLDQGVVRVRWQDGPLHLVLHAYPGWRAVLDGNVDHVSLGVAKAAAADLLSRLGIDDKGFQGFEAQTTIC